MSAQRMRRQAQYLLAIGLTLVLTAAILLGATWGRNRGAMRMHDQQPAQVTP